MPEASSARGRIITFYSYKGGTGRTMALANVAWIAASKGCRVLAVDWDLESPGLHRYFHPFLLDKQLRSSRGVIDMIRDYAAATLDRSPPPEDDLLWLDRYAQVFQYAISLNWDFPDGGRLDLLPPGQQDPSYTKAVSTFDWDTFYERQNGGAFLDALRENMRRHYDYVLIDSRTGLSDAAGICTIHMPDMVVDCFTMSDQSIEGAAAVARSIVNQRVDEPIRVVPVPMRVEDAEQFKLEAGRDIARLRFGPFLTGLSAEEAETYWGDVEIPYKPFYAYEEILAPFGDRPRLENSLLAAFERLTRILTDGAVQTTGQLPDADRRQWLAEFERTRPVPGHDVVISYATVDRVWADWISSELMYAGLTVRLQAVDAAAGPAVLADLERGLTAAGQVMVLLSQVYAAAPYAADLWKAATARDLAGRPKSMVPVRIDSVRLAAPFIERAPVELTGTSPDRARDALRHALDLAAPAPDEPRAANAPRFPGTPPPVWNVPPRGTAFVGRGRALEELRDRLSGTVTTLMPQAVHGLGGVGKTQLAIEYAHRFAGDYDLVWWVDAEEPDRVRSALADLAGELRLPSAAGVQKAAEDVLEALRQGRPHPRWLIILDNADNPDALREFLPQGTGHVLITSRNQLWTKHVPAVELGVFDRDESVRLLRDRMPGLSEAEADQVADRLGDLPLAIEQAAAWLTLTAMPVDQYLHLLETSEVIRILSENQPPNYPRSAVATWLLSLQRLRDQSPAAAGLLEMCSFLAPEEIPVSLFAGDRFARLITRYDPTLRDPILQSLVIREIGRYALAKVDARNNSIKIHRLVQAAIRDQIDPAARDEMRENAQELLVAANPGDPDKPGNWPRYAELSPHLRPAGMVDATSPESRQLIVDMVRFLHLRGDSASSQHLAEEALSRWREAGCSEDDVIMLMLRFNLANVQRMLADYDAARTADEDVHERLTRLLGKGHPYTLITGRSLGADLRALGRYGEAERLDRQTVQGFAATFGVEHPQTLGAEHNHAVSLRLVGDFRSAADHDQRIYHTRLDRFGERDPATLVSASYFGRDLRDIGDLRGSAELLSRTLAMQRQAVGTDHRQTLRTAQSLGSTLRQLGRLAEAYDLIADTFARYERGHGSRHPETMSCEMTLATVHSAAGDDVAAVRTARALLSRHREVLGEHHSFTLACAHNLA
ncbi:MAG TPA: FxSxx-COOH system tetratricopeptide repeat protein, partial [Micromonosporaceae bacterium]